MKKSIRNLLLLLLIITTAIVITSCGKKGDGQISVSADAMPQLVHVKGEELDLSSGMLVVTRGGETKEISLADSGVSVSGYDKNTLGEQTVTISYDGLSTKLTVNVVERMRAEDVVEHYLVGDAFDVTRGRVKITRNDGTSLTAILNSDKVTVNGFDSTTAGEKTVSATYKNGDTEYSCQFKVTVHAIDSVRLVEPTKTTYNSHDDGISLKNGKLVITGYNGELTREIPLDSDGVEISGFDLSVVNEENSPVRQDVTVNYGGESYTYKVTITYTDVTMFRDNAAALAALDFTGEALPDISDELGELAIELMELYFSFTPAEQGYIPEAEALLVARTAFAYGLLAVDDDLAALEGGFTIVYGQPQLTCDTREGVALAVEVLRDKDGELYRVTDLLLALSEHKSFKNAPLLDHGASSLIFFGSFSFTSTEMYESMLGIFEHMLAADALMTKIPANWAENGFDAYADAIDDLYALMYNTGYVANGWGDIYATVDAWSADVDVIDVMYEYYYTNEIYEALGVLTYVRFPSWLHDIAMNLGYALDEFDMLNADEETGRLYDSTWFIYYCYVAQRDADLVKLNAPEWVKELYDILPLNGLLGFDGEVAWYIDDLLDYLTNAEGGIYYYLGGVLGNERANTVLNLYVCILEKLFNDADGSYYGSAQYGTDIEAMFAAYLDLTSTEQYLFIGAISTNYIVGEPPLAFDDTNAFYSDMIPVFVILVNDYYRGLFTAGGDTVYDNLIIAIELYSLRFFDENGYTDFVNKMNAVTSAINAIKDTADYEVFQTHLESVYNKYMGYVELHKPENKPTDLEATLGEWYDDFLALQDALINVEMAYYYSFDEETGELLTQTLLLSAFERAAKLYNYIEKNAPENIVKILHNSHIYNIVGVEDDGEFHSSFEFTLNDYRSTYIYFLLSAIEGGTYDVYVGSPLQDAMEKSYDVVWPYFWYLFDNASGLEGTLVFDDTAVMAALNAFEALSADQKFIFMVMEGDAGYFYASRDAYAEQKLTEGALAHARNMFSADSTYLMYVFSLTEESRTALVNALAALEEEHINLSVEDAASFDIFNGIYNSFVEKCNEVLNPTTDTEQTPAA